MISSDASKPIKGNSLRAIDGFAGYSTKILRNKVGLRVQLNVRNLFDDDTWSVQQAYSDGTPRNFNLPQPRTFILTSTFTY